MMMMMPSNNQNQNNMPMNLLLLSVFACCCTFTSAFQVAMPLHQTQSTTARASMTRQYYSAAMEPPSAGFEERMRELVQPAQPPTTKNKSVAPSAPAYVQAVTNLQEYKTIIADEQTSVTAVRFYAPWCRSCRAIEAPFYRLGRDDKMAQVKFAQVPVTKDNISLHQGLGVTSLPYSHIYHPTAGLVEELKIGKQRFGDFDRILQSYNDGECALATNVDADSGVYEAPYMRHS